MNAAPRTPALDELLVHAAWVRALARRLVRDPDAAEDVVQETWIAALERPPGDRENLRGWLATVVQNAARMRGRAGARRAAREARVAAERPHEVPSSEELATRLETQRRLAQRVLELAEPLRSTVILRFHEGLSAAEIARRTDTPLGTVRARLARALAELRGRLDDDFGGERAAWVALVLPLARRDTALGLGAGSGATLLQGMLAMNLGTKLTLAAAVVALTLAVTPLGSGLLDLVQGQRAVDETPVAVSFRPVERPAAPGLEPAPAAARAAVPATARPAETSALAAPTAGFRLRVIDERGAPLAGARLALRWRKETSATADGAGVVTLLLDEATLAAGYGEALLVSCPDYATRELGTQPDPRRVVELGDVALTPAGAIEGRVFLADGRPAPGAWVRLAEDHRPSRREYAENRIRRTAHGGNWGDPEADQAGRFHLEGVPIGTAHVWAGAEGALAARTNPIEVRRGMVSEGVELVLGELDPADFIHGQVLLPDGTPAARARVEYEYRVSRGSGSGSLGADEDGRFVLANAPRGPRTLSAQDRDGQFAWVRLTGVEGGSDPVLRLGESHFLALSVRDEAGPLAAPEVWGFDAEHVSLLVRADRVRERDGRLQVPVPDEPFLLEVSAPGHELVTVGPLPGRAAPAELEVVLGRLPGLRGTVMAGGAALSGASVELYAPTTQRMIHNGFPVRLEAGPKAAGASDADGVFDLTFRASGAYVVRVSAEGWAPAELGPLELDPARGLDGLLVELTEGGTLAGFVQLPGGAGAAGRIVAISRGDAHPRSTRCDADGAYRFEHLTPGRWQVELGEEEFSPGNGSTEWDGRPFREADIVSNCTVFEGETTRFDLGERRPGQVVVEGRILIDGAAPEGWTAILLPLGEVYPATDDEPAVDAEGRFRLELDEPGDYRLSVRGDERYSGLVTSVLSLPVGLTRWEAAYATGELVLTNVPPLSASNDELRMLVAERGDFAVLLPLLPDEEGRVSLSAVPAGALMVRHYRREEMTSRDPLTTGRTVLEVQVRAGERVEAALP